MPRPVSATQNRTPSRVTVEPDGARDPALVRARGVLRAGESAARARYRSAAQFAHALNYTIPIEGDDLPSHTSAFSIEVPTRDGSGPTAGLCFTPGCFLAVQRI